MRKVVEFLAILLLSPLSLIAFKHWLFDLKPLKHWELPVFVLSLLCCEVGAILAVYFPNKRDSKRRKNWTLISGVVILLVVVYLYSHATETPPDEAWRDWYNLGAYIWFFTSYFAYGYVSARVFSFIVQETLEHFDKK